MDDAVRIAFESGLPYTGLRDFAADPRLWRYLPLGIAQAERIVPVVLVGDVLTVAAARPDPDLSHLRTHFPHLEVAVVIAPAGDIDTVLLRAQGIEP